VDHWPGSAVMQTQVRNDTWRPLVLPVVEIHRTGYQMSTVVWLREAA
jgi:hypothetical protein